MGDSTNLYDATRLLQGLERGGLAVSEARIIAEDLDPVLVHLIINYVRASYPISAPAASAVLERLVELTNAYPGIVSYAKSGESDPITEWIKQEHSGARGEEMLSLAVDKLES
jgi:hypothetical protein